MRHVIVGNGPAGVIAAETLRAQRPDDDITLVGDEPEPPYSRMAIPYLLPGDIGGGNPSAQGSGSPRLAQQDVGRGQHHSASVGQACSRESPRQLNLEHAVALVIFR
jgi:hypothetical protein